MKAAVAAVLAGGVLAAAGAGTQPGLAIGFVRRAQRQRRIHSPSAENITTAPEYSPRGPSSRRRMAFDALRLRDADALTAGNNALPEIGATAAW